jgi:NitT/TauT family transport system substrate-binding protein
LLRLAASVAVAGPAIDRAAAARADDVLPIRVATATSDSYGEPYYAADGGFFTRAGLDATMLNFGNGSQALTALASGSADVGLTNPVSLVQAIQSGLPFTCIAGSCYYSSAAPTTGLFVAKDAPFRGARDLEGKTIALGSLKSLDAGAISAWFEKSGADVTKATIVEVPFAEMSAAVQRGTVAAASIPEPFMSAGAPVLRLIAKQYDLISPRFYIDVWAASTSFVAQHPQAARRFVSAIYAAARWANSNHDKTAPILAKYSKMDLATIQVMTRASYAESRDVRDLQPVLDTAYKYKLFANPQKAEDIFSTV